MTTGVDVAGLAQDVPSLCRARSIIIYHHRQFAILSSPTSTYTYSLHTFLLLTPYALLLLYIPIVFIFGILITDSVLTTTTVPLSADIDRQSAMSLSRSPSPRPEGGWSSPGLQSSSGSSTPGSGLLTPSSGVSWAAAKAKSDEVRGYPSSSQRSGFFSRSTRRIYSSLPRFSTEETGDYADKDEKDELGQGKKYSHGPGRGLFAFPRTLVRRTRLRTLLGSILAFVAFFFFCSCAWTSALVPRCH